jgi:hypothetical protein
LNKEMKFAHRVDALPASAVSLRLTLSGTRPYSLSFRTERLNLDMQRLVGSVGVEALLGCAFADSRLTIIVA